MTVARDDENNRWFNHLCLLWHPHKAISLGGDDPVCLCQMPRTLSMNNIWYFNKSFLNKTLPATYLEYGTEWGESIGVDLSTCHPSKTQLTNPTPAQTRHRTRHNPHAILRNRNRVDPVSVAPEHIQLCARRRVPYPHSLVR
jgi:hypothetical protein